MIRKAFVMQVNPDAHEEYQRRHNPIWPELEAVLKSHGAHNYAIYLDKARNLLFAMVEIWICPYISRHLLSLNPLQARCRRYSRGER
ncbi:L-rhamnose mutarotase [Escherichia coli]